MGSGKKGEKGVGMKMTGGGFYISCFSERLGT